MTQEQELLNAARWAAAYIVQGANCDGFDNATPELKAAHKILREAIATYEEDASEIAANLG